MALAGVAVDAVFDSVSVATTFKEKLNEAGVIFCPISEAIRDYPDLVKKYLGTVVPVTDNFFATLNSAVFSDGTFVYVPKGVRCPMELSTYFRINAQRDRPVRAHADHRRRRLLCLLSRRLHRAQARREPAACRGGRTGRAGQMPRSNIRRCRTGIRATRTGRAASTISSPSAAIAAGDRSKISWTQVETGSAITWKYPSCILRGDDSVGEFYSIAIANNFQQADTGTKMIHLGKNTRSRIISKGISAGKAQNTYRGLVSVHPQGRRTRATTRNATRC